MHPRCGNTLPFSMSHLNTGANWNDDWGLSSVASISSKQQLNIRESHADSDGDSNITRPLSVVRGATFDPFREVMNSIKELEKPEPDHQDFGRFKPAVSFEEIYPDNDEDEVSFSQVHSEEKEQGYSTKTKDPNLRGVRFHAL